MEHTFQGWSNSLVNEEGGSFLCRMKWLLTTLQNQFGSIRKDEGNCNLHLNIRNMLYAYNNQQHNYCGSSQFAQKCKHFYSEGK